MSAARAPRPTKTSGATFPPRPTRAEVTKLRRDLLAWYDAHKRALPWRTRADPYRVWVSEAMLQQTRVETVIPYFARFLARFPSLAALAAAPVEDVLAVWSGLGYYSRARTLHAAARSIMAVHDGRMPQDREQILALPGIGPYTAGAILSIAFDQPEPLVDGNVARVFARLFELADDPSSPALSREMWARAADLVGAGDRAGDWNQALMELGALVCTPPDPKCADCPLASGCRARRAGRVAELPWPKARKTAVDVALTILVVEQRGRFLAEQRPATGRMAGLWQLPTVERASGADGRLFPTRWPGTTDARGRSSPAFSPGDELGEVTHTITHHRIRAIVRRGSIETKRIESPLAWFRAPELAELPLTGMARKVLAAHFFRNEFGDVLDVGERAS
jgi:A/G-specific adenine glycosylase